MIIEGIPEGWELVRIGNPIVNVDLVIGSGGLPELFNWTTDSHNWPIIRKIEKPKKFRPFANAAEYVAAKRYGFPVDWKTDNDVAPGFFAVVSANEMFIWVDFGTAVETFDWEKALEKLVFRNIDSSTSPFGIEVTE